MASLKRELSTRDELYLKVTSLTVRKEKSSNPAFSQWCRRSVSKLMNYEHSKVPSSGKHLIGSGFMFQHDNDKQNKEMSGDSRLLYSTV